MSFAMIKIWCEMFVYKSPNIDSVFAVHLAAKQATADMHTEPAHELLSAHVRAALTWRSARHPLSLRPRGG